MMICSDAGAITCVVSSMKHCMDVTISPPIILIIKLYSPSTNKQVNIDFVACSPFNMFLPVLKVFDLFSVKTLCTEMCVTVYYLNVSGLQSDRHSNKKENMFWTTCFCS